jgi:ketosteroid isomerase-like protein
MLELYRRLSSGDPAVLGEYISTEEDAFVLGTDWDQFEDGRDAWIAAYKVQTGETPEFRIEPGERLRGQEEGSVGWAVDQPNWVFGDGTAIPIRITALFRQEGGGWKVVNAHFSFGVPDARLEELLPQLLG